MKFSPEEKAIINFYNTSSRKGLIAEMEIAVEHIEDEELHDTTQFIINKLTFMTDDEFEATDFASTIDSED